MRAFYAIHKKGLPLSNNSTKQRFSSRPENEFIKDVWPGALLNLYNFQSNQMLWAGLESVNANKFICLTAALDTEEKLIIA